jgi:hypothetical protein
MLDPRGCRNRFSLAKNSTASGGGYSHIQRLPESNDSEDRPSPNIGDPGCLVLNIVGAAIVATRKTQGASRQRKPPFVEREGYVQQAHPGWAILGKGRRGAEKTDC